MPKACAKTVHNRCVSGSKKCVRLSTRSTQKAYRITCMWVKSLVLPQLSHGKTTWFSTAKKLFLPLLNSKFYPLSTAPTIITTNKIY